MPERTVNPRYVAGNFTAAAGTTAAAPTRTTVDLDQVELVEWFVLIPPGHGGLTGIALELAGERVVPFGPGSPWIIGDDAREVFDLGIEVDAGLRVAVFNLDVFAHTFYTRFKVADILAAGLTPARVTLDAL